MLFKKLYFMLRGGYAVELLAVVEVCIRELPEAIGIGGVS